MNLVNINSAETITTLQLREMINAARVAAGEPNIENRHFIARVEDEIDDLPPRKYFTHPSNSQSSYFYDLTIEQATLVGMRESKSVRRAVRDVLKEMASQLQKVELPDFTKPAIAARAWAEQYEKAQTLAIENKEQAKQLEEAAPALKFVSDFIVAKGDVSLRQAAKELMQSPMAFNRQLAELGIIYKLGDTWTAKQSHINAGRLVMKAILCDDGEHRPQCNVTPKGIEYIAQRLAELNQE